MNPLNYIKKIFIGVARYFYHIVIPDYVIKTVSDDAPWLYFSYLPHVFKHINDKEYMSRHQNLMETVIMVKTFNNLGYNVFLHNYASSWHLPNIKPKIIIGLEHNFNRACQKWPDAKKIYFATGAYWEHANRQISQMTDYINQSYKCHIDYKRMTNPHQASQLADEILQIGSSYTVLTYPKELRYKITTIDQSSLGEVFEKNYSLLNEFFFMGSSGNILKGVSLLLEFFSRHQEYILNWVGPIDDDFQKALGHLFTPNIKTYGFVNMNSLQMKEIVSRCNFVIYPSGTEGGCPGAVINSMKMGLIPIVTPWAAFDGIESVGFIMKDWNLQSITDGINWALSKNKAEIESLSSKCIESVRNRFTLERFEAQLENYMKTIMKKL